MIDKIFNKRIFICVPNAVEFILCSEGFGSNKFGSRINGVCVNIEISKLKPVKTISINCFHLCITR